MAGSEWLGGWEQDRWLGVGKWVAGQAVGALGALRAAGSLQRSPIYRAHASKTTAI